jgi:4-hydroxy-2-oxoheptanedioate aldolase
MDLPRNKFKAALVARRQQLGLWCTLGDPNSAEAVAGSGFDWLLLDTEHSPTDVLTVLPVLQAVASYDAAAVVRPATNDTVLIKRYLDIGVQTLLIPYVQSAAEAQHAVAAMRYPPRGVRGVASVTRATRFGRVDNYARHASDELCLLVQIESQAGLDALEEIAAVEGVDGIFIGPADLAASLGHLGEPGHPVVKAAIEDALKRIKACGTPSGILTTDHEFARKAMALGSCFTALGIDVDILARATEALAAQFRE